MPTLAKNAKARFDYEILETYEAGLKLLGHEVKSVRNGHMKLAGAFVHVRNNKAILVGANISPYPQAGPLPDYDPMHTRELLLSKKELNILRGKTDEDGLTIVPLSVYTKGPYIKMELGLGRGKKHYDKRETIKKRDLDRAMRRGEE